MTPSAPHGQNPSTATIGFACNWDASRETTWSGTPWQLYTALAERAAVIDLGIQLPPAIRQAFKVAHARRHDGRWSSQWKWSRAWEQTCERVLTSRARRAGCEVVLQVHDLATISLPFFTFQDLSMDTLLEYERTTGRRTPAFEHISRRSVQRWAERQRAYYASATGVFALSRWLAHSLTALSGLPEEKVHVVHPGINVPVRQAADPPPRGPERRRLLFVGRDFARKAGPSVVDAFTRLRSTRFPDLELTICGPEKWPMTEAPPEGVRFLGAQPAEIVANLYREHDLFVMPSHFEAFGIVFAEAFVAGIPCIGRNACAMPEMIQEAHNGALVRSDDPEELADVIGSTLLNDALYERCWNDRSAAARYYSWDRAADEILEYLKTVPT